MVNLVSRVIAGSFMVLTGIILLVVAFFGLWWVLIYAIPLLVIGLFVLFNKKEDIIEEIQVTE